MWTGIEDSVVHARTLILDGDVKIPILAGKTLCAESDFCLCVT